MKSSARSILLTVVFAVVASSVPYSFTGEALAQEFIAQIIGGRPAPSLLQGPVSLVFTGNSVCSGVLVGSRTVLTAGHCAPENFAIDNYRIVVGGETYRITAFTTHPLFDIAASARESAPYDVGVIELSRMPRVAPIPVFIDRPLSPGTELTIAGYGTHESSAEAREPEEFAKLGRSVVDNVSRDGVIFQRHAGGGASTCPGDSGGPAILRDSGYRGVAGTLSIGTNQMSDNNCTLAGGGRFGHVYLQSSKIRQFLSLFPDIQYISGYRIFVESAARSSATTLRRISRTSSISKVQRSIKNVLASVSKAREYADGIRYDLLSQALRDLRAGVRSRRLATVKSRVRAAIQRLNEVKALGIS